MVTMSETRIVRTPTKVARTPIKSGKRVNVVHIAEFLLKNRDVVYARPGEGRRFFTRLMDQTKRVDNKLFNFVTSNLSQQVFGDLDLDEREYSNTIQKLLRSIAIHDQSIENWEELLNYPKNTHWNSKAYKPRQKNRTFSSGTSL